MTDREKTRLLESPRRSEPATEAETHTAVARRGIDGGGLRSEQKEHQGVYS